MALSIFKNRYSSADAKFISDKAFYAVVAATLLFGFAVNALEVILLGDIISQWVYGGGNYLIFVICYFVMAIAGVCINSFSRKPLLSFIGYCLVVLPIGAVLALVVLIFCCYIGFDISLAKSRPKTLDNAVDSACGLYLDIINLFIRLLAIFGRND